MKRPHQLAFRVTLTEARLIRKAARLTGFTPSEWMRFQLVRIANILASEQGR